MQKFFVEVGGHQITIKEVVLKPGAKAAKMIKTNEKQMRGSPSSGSSVLDPTTTINSWNGPRGISVPQTRRFSVGIAPMVEKNLRNYASGSAVAPDLDTYDILSHLLTSSHGCSETSSFLLLGNVPKMAL